MSDARKISDRVTDAMNRHDVAAAADCYSTQAVVVAPEGSFEGRDQARAYLEGFLRSFPDLTITSWSKVTSGDLAIDEWTFAGTNTGPVELPDGRNLPATGRSVTVRGCDVATVEDGEIISHRVYFDEMELLGQLGLLEQQVS